MAFRDILEAFAEVETLPVDLNEVSRWIIQRGIQDEIEFIGVDLDIGVLRGFLHRFRYTAGMYGEARNATNIYYGRNQASDWINLVCAKELIHLMANYGQVTKKGDLDTLIKRLTLPREIKILLEDPEYAKIDKFGDFIAAALLFPHKLRAELMIPFKAGAITAEDIAAMACIPVRYARIMMLDEWDPLYSAIMAMP